MPTLAQIERDLALDENEKLKDEIERLREALQYVYEQDRGYVIPHGYAVDPSRVLEHEPGKNVLYLGHMGVKARDALAAYQQSQESK